MPSFPRRHAHAPKNTLTGADANRSATGLRSEMPLFAMLFRPQGDWPQARRPAVHGGDLRRANRVTIAKTPARLNAISIFVKEVQTDTTCPLCARPSSIT